MANPNRPWPVRPGSSACSSAVRVQCASSSASSHCRFTGLTLYLIKDAYDRQAGSFPRAAGATRMARPAFCGELFGRDTPPMIFQYNALDYVIETSPDRELLVAIGRQSGAAPKLRYSISDSAGTYTFRTLAARLARTRSTLPFRTLGGEAGSCQIGLERLERSAAKVARYVQGGGAVIRRCYPTYGTYSSAVFSVPLVPFPPATSTCPSGSRVAVRPE
ncbi:hypothetical protein R75461_08329 [Paraburkholderia nemoris]|nr:hypothetical protein R75461_08329 [Paraburkholderia nemoris]